MTPEQFALLMQLADQGLAYWTTVKTKAVDGTATQADLDEAMSKLDVDIDKLETDINKSQET